MGRNQKRKKKEKNETGSRNSVIGVRSEQCVGGMNSGKQEAKFRRLRNFPTCEILQVAKISQSGKIHVVLHFHAFSALLSFWFLICNAEFDLNSSCLDHSTILVKLACKNYKISHKM